MSDIVLSGTNIRVPKHLYLNGRQTQDQPMVKGDKTTFSSVLRTSMKVTRAVLDWT